VVSAVLAGVMVAVVMVVVFGESRAAAGGEQTRGQNEGGQHLRHRLAPHSDNPVHHLPPRGLFQRTQMMPPRAAVALAQKVGLSLYRTVDAAAWVERAASVGVAG